MAVDACSNFLPFCLELPRLHHYEPVSVPLSANFTLKCAVEAKPRADIAWKIHRHVSSVSAENFVIISRDEGSPFTVSVSYNGNLTISTLSIKNAGLCFNDTIFSCWGRNAIQRSTVMQQFKINRGILSKIFIVLTVLRRSVYPEVGPISAAWNVGNKYRSEDTSLRWRVVGDTVSDLTPPGVESQTFRTESNLFITTTPTGLRMFMKCTSLLLGYGLRSFIAVEMETYQP